MAGLIGDTIRVSNYAPVYIPSVPSEGLLGSVETTVHQKNTALYDPVTGITYYLSEDKVVVQAPSVDQGAAVENASFAGSVFTIENSYAPKLASVYIEQTNLPDFNDANLSHDRTSCAVNYAGISLPSDEPAYLEVGLRFEHKVHVDHNEDGTTIVTGLANDQQINSHWYDTMTGGGVHESFVFKPHFGQDEITDLILGGRHHDVIKLSSSEFDSMAQVLQQTEDVNGSAVIHVSPTDSITIDGVTKADLAAHPHDVMFHP